MIHPDVESVLLTREELSKRVHELAGEIARDAEGREPLVIGVLKGSFIFIADLLRAMDTNCGVDFMAVSSYGRKSESTGQVRILKDIGQDIEGRYVVIVEDILDSGATLDYIMRILRERRPEAIRLCTLLDKPERRKIDVSADYVGFTVPDSFVVGYGLDYAERYRNLPYIGILRPSVYGNA